MIREHGPTLLKESGASASAASTPAAPKTSESSSTQSGASTTSKPTAGTSGGNTLNTTTVKLSSAFKIAAKDLFELLTDASKVPMWTRNPAKIQPEAGAEVDLFGGNIQGKMISVSKPNQIVMSWRPPQWEAGHYGTLTMNLDQGSGETVLALRLDGVPIGKEDEIEKNLDTFYMRSLKQIGSVLYPHLPEPSSCLQCVAAAGDSLTASSLQHRTMFSLLGLFLALLIANLSGYVP